MPRRKRCEPQPGSARPFSVIVPVPPSVNHAYKDVTINGTSRRALTEEAATYKAGIQTYVRGIANQQGWTPGAATRFALFLEVWFPDKRRASSRDMDSCFKLLQDAIAKGLGFNDNRIKLIGGANEGADEVEPRCIATLIPLRRLEPGMLRKLMNVLAEDQEGHHVG